MKHPQEEKSKKLKVLLNAKNNKPMAMKLHVKKNPAKGWIESFCESEEHSIFCQVQKEFIEEDFNLTGLKSQVENYNLAHEMILGRRKNGRESEVDEDAEKLYGLIHSRFITTAKGLDLMLKKFEDADFEECPRTSCDHQICLPIGFYDEPGVATMRYFCPRCQQVYIPSCQEHRDIDGAYFGSTFAHLLVMTYPNKFTRPRNAMTTSDYVPRIFGFRIHNPDA